MFQNLEKKKHFSLIFICYEVPNVNLKKNKDNKSDSLLASQLNLLAHSFSYYIILPHTLGESQSVSALEVILHPPALTTALLNDKFGIPILTLRNF